MSRESKLIRNSVLRDATDCSSNSMTYATVASHCRRKQSSICTAVQDFGIYTISAWSMTVAMNLEYQMHVQAPALRDVAFEMLFELPARMGLITEYMLHSVLIFCISGAMFNFTIPGRGGKVTPRYDLISAWLRCMTILNVLRISSFLVTQLPGPAEHCRPGSTTYNPPTTIFERANFQTGCGDLLFSGHTMLLCTCMMLLTEVFRSRRVLCALLWVYFGAFCVLVLSFRKHYTVDVLVAVYTAPLVWNRFRTGWFAGEAVAPSVRRAIAEQRAAILDEPLEPEQHSVPEHAQPERVSTLRVSLASSSIILSAWLWLHLIAPTFREEFSQPVVHGLLKLPALFLPALDVPVRGQLSSNLSKQAGVLAELAANTTMSCLEMFGGVYNTAATQDLPCAARV